MRKITALIKITRPINVIFTFLVVFVSIFICSQNFNFSVSVFLASLAAALVAASGNIINDYFDYKIDKINRPNRPIPNGSINKTEALGYYIFMSIIAIFISYNISINALIIIIITTIILFLYSKFLKGIPLIGNITVAICTALAFVYGGIIANNIEVSIIPALFAFLINLIREILKDVEDLEGDKELGLNTFPIKYGIERTTRMLVIISSLLIVSTFYPYLTMLYNIEYFIIVLFPVNLPIVYFIKKIIFKEYLHKTSQFSLLLKVVMLFGLFAIYMGVN